MVNRALRGLVIVLTLCGMSLSQNSDPSIPRLLRFSGTIKNSGNTPRTGVVGVMFSLYTEQQGGTALWTELQNVTLDANGQYTVLLGSQHSDGVPPELFTTNEARWLGIQVEAEPEQARVLLVSVPYALKAGDAETLGGRPLSSFVLMETNTSNANTNTSSTSATTQGTGVTRVLAAPVNTAGGTQDFVSKFDATGTNLVNSVIFDNGRVGIGTVTPLFSLDVVGGIEAQLAAYPQINFKQTGGGGAVAQEYRYQIDPDGSYRIYDMTSGVIPRFVMTKAGQIGIGTTSPTYNLDVVVGAQVQSSQYPQFNFKQTGGGGASAQEWRFQINPDASYHIYDITGGIASRFVILPNGNIGISTDSPGQRLSVAGMVESTSGGFKFPDGSVMASANTANFASSTTDQVIHVTQNGAGAINFTVSTLPAAIRGDSSTTSNYSSGVLGTSASPLGFGVAGENLASSDVAIGTYGLSTQSTTGTGVWGEAESNVATSSVGVFGKVFTPGTSGCPVGGCTSTGVFGYAKAFTGDGVGVYGLSDSVSGTGVWGNVSAGSGETFGVYGSIASPDMNAGAGVFDNTATGNLVVGRSTTNHIRVFRIDTTGKGFFNNGTQVGGADFAESVEALGGVAQYEPGDVMAIDPDGKRRITLATEPYSTRVAGIYSTKPGVLATAHEMDDPKVAGEVPLAIVGIVPCKVSAENGPIKAGDLLVSASVAGYAMKGTDRSRLPGAVIGKALDNLDGGKGLIQVLVSLQ